MLPRPALVCLGLFGLLALGAEGWTPADAMKIRSVSEVTPSPNGKLVAWTEQWAVMEEDKSEYRSHIWVANSDGTGRYQLTRGGKSANAIEFSPDGEHIYFVSERTGKKNLFRIRVAGGEAEQITDWKGSIGAFDISPDGKLASVAAAEEDKEQEKRKKAKTDVRVIGENPRNHSLYVLNLDGPLPAEFRKLAGGEFHVRGMAWSPDSTRIAISRTPRPDANDARKADIVEIEIAGGGETAVVVSEREERDPLYSPDGRYLAYLRSVSPSGVPGARIVVWNRATGEARELPATPDQRPHLVDWTADSRRLIFWEPEGTANAISFMPLDGPTGKLARPAGVAAPDSFSSRSGHLGLTMQSLQQPVEAYVARIEGDRLSVPVRVSAANTALELPELPKTEVIRWRSADGREIEGLLTYPLRHTPGKPAPLVLVIHGGPAGIFQERFVAGPNLHPVASFAHKGYAVLQPNPRGSTGYGPAFRELVVKDWGGKDFQDLMSGVDHVISLGVADPDRLAVMGWSYGGFMTAWTVTQTTRFKAAVVGAGITNNVSMYGTQDIPSVYEDYFGGPPWDHAAVYAASSPIENVRNVRTPTLIIHGENDPRVPVGQAYEFHRALERRGVETQMVVYPRMAHGPTEPKFLQDIAERHLAWVEKHLQ